MEVINWDVELSWVLESLLALFTIRPFDPALGMCCLVTLVAHHGNNGNSALYCTLNTVLPVWVVYNGEYSVVYKLQTYQLCAHCVLYSVCCAVQKTQLYAEYRLVPRSALRHSPWPFLHCCSSSLHPHSLFCSLYNSILIGKYSAKIRKKCLQNSQQKTL